MFLRPLFIYGKNLIASLDALALGAALLIAGAGLVTMHSFSTEGGLFARQLMWICVSFFASIVCASFDYRPLRKTWVVVTLYGTIISLLLLLLVFGTTVNGAQSWFSWAGFSFQPSDPAKIVLILMLAKYFSRRHVEIGNSVHVLISGLYAAVFFALILFQPDFGSAIIMFLIWFGMVLVSGMNKRHLAFVMLAGIISFTVLWTSVFAPYQKQRILTFISPLADIRGAGYNAYQSTIAVGSGELLGKGVGFGTQSRLQFLPEYETDFIFAAFAEEWGFVGVVLLLALFALLLYRILKTAYFGASNFETLFGVGFAIFLLAHFTIHVGMNIGLLPVTGLTMPFMSYGGSHLLTEFIGLGIVMGMGRYRRVAHREMASADFIDPK